MRISILTDIMIALHFFIMQIKTIYLNPNHDSVCQTMPKMEILRALVLSLILVEMGFTAPAGLFKSLLSNGLSNLIEQENPMEVFGQSRKLSKSNINIIRMHVITIL